MLDQLLNYTLPHWMNSLTPYDFVKSFGALCDVVVHVKGMVVNSEHRLVCHAGFLRKSMLNYGF